MKFGTLLANQVFIGHRDSLLIYTAAPVVFHLVDTLDKGRHTDLLLTLLADDMRLNLLRVKFKKLHHAVNHLVVKLVIGAMKTLNLTVFDYHCQDI